MYVFLPETENRTLEEVELYFSDKSRKLTDRHVKKTSDLNNMDLKIGGIDNKGLEV